MNGDIEDSSEHSGNMIRWVVQFVQILAAAVFTWEGVAKIAGQDAKVEMFARLGFGEWFRFVVGGAEIACALMLLLPPSARAGAVLLAVLMIGAAVTDISYLNVAPVLPLTLLALMIFVVVMKRKKKAHPAKHSFASR